MLDSALGGPGGALASWLDALARRLVALGIGPNAVSGAALVLGLGGAGLFYFDHGWWAMLAIVGSGVMDAVDGRVARLGPGPTPWGGVLDLTFDRIVEASVLLGMALPRPEWHLPALVLACTWYVNLCVFLAVGAASDRRSEKVIVYAPGLLERGELLLLALVVVALPAYGSLAAYVYAALEVVTGAQRFRYGRRALRGGAHG